MSADTIFDAVAAGAKAVIDAAEISSLGEPLTVYDTEPRTLNLPAVAIAGPTSFSRRGLDERDSQLGARDWLITYRLTVFVALGGDIARDQRIMRGILGSVIDAIDNAPQLSGALPLLDSKLTNGTQSFTAVRDDDGNAQRQMVVYECDLSVWVLQT